MAPNYKPTIDRLSGFAGIYDAYRPAPPDVIGQYLPALAKSAPPALVVDLGCGTGLSTRFWGPIAGQVIGIDLSEDMLNQARANTQYNNVYYQAGFAHDSGLPSGCADIITACQSLHWMDPEPTLAEIARLLRPGGVFAAIDYNLPPTTLNWEADAAYRAYDETASAVYQSMAIEKDISRWKKNEHLARLKVCGHFRFTNELLVHNFSPGNAERLVGLAMSMGALETALKAGASEHELGLDTLRAEVKRLLGEDQKPWLWSAYIRLAVK